MLLVLLLLLRRTTRWYAGPLCCSAADMRDFLKQPKYRFRTT
jgi:hypothetical protein